MATPPADETWAQDGVTFITPVDFGDQFTSTTIVMPSFRPGQTSGTLQQRRFPPPQGERRPEFAPRDAPTSETRNRSEIVARPADERTTASQAARRGRRGPNPFRRPPGMTDAQFEELSRSRGLHGFVITLSRADYDRAVNADFWQRVIAAFIAALAGGGLGIAWHQAQKSARLQLRLQRASQMNMHLQELNLAAAGLAHETRNPLNIIRGLAQLITQRPSSAELHSRAQDIAQEVDRVTSRLNEFINYSRPPEPRPAPLNFRSVVMDVVRALETDMTDKEIRFEPDGIDGSIEADQALLRQMLFNLLLNAVQAVGRGGLIQVGLRATGLGEAAFEVCDNGPGVPPDQREQVFRPYFTTRENGTGLGLAIVRQIALAHQWEIECLDNRPGARFRVRGIKLVPRSAAHPDSPAAVLRHS
jgi:signal transduction histidine kinase